VAQQPIQQQTNAETTPLPDGGGGGGTGEGETYTPNNVLFNGQWYDLNNPTDQMRFFQDKLVLLTTARDQAISEGQRTSDKQIHDLDQAIADTQTQAEQYVQDYQKRVNTFGEEKNLGDIKRGQYFAGLSPNAFQSSQGSSGQYAQKQYLQGLGDMTQEAQGNVGLNYLGNPKDVSQLAPGSTFGRQLGGYQEQKSDVANAFQNYVNQQNQNVQQQASSTATDLAPTNQFDYTAKINSITPSSVNLAPYQQYTNFQAPGTYTGGILQKPVFTNKFTGQEPLDAALGRNPVSAKEKDYIRSYLLGQTA